MHVARVSGAGGKSRRVGACTRTCAGCKETHGRSTGRCKEQHQSLPHGIATESNVSKISLTDATSSP